MNKYLAAGGLTAVAIAGLFAIVAGTVESSEDMARKPDIVQMMMTTSLQKCDIGASIINPADYGMRLEEVLMHTRSDTLDFLVANNITVCLDQRLANEPYGFFDTHVNGVFYPDAENPILSLWDNGADSGNHGFFEWTAATNGPRYLQEFKNEFSELFTSVHQISDITAPMYAYQYQMTTSCGKSCTTSHTEYDWHLSSDWGWGDFMEQHPNLANLPVTTQYVSAPQAVYN